MRLPADLKDAKALLDSFPGPGLCRTMAAPLAAELSPGPVTDAVAGVGPTAIHNQVLLGNSSQEAASARGDLFNRRFGPERKMRLL